MTEQEIRKLIPELVWMKFNSRLDSYGHEEYQAIDYRLGLEKVYYRIVHYSRDPEGMYYISKAVMYDPDKEYPSWLITTAYSLKDAMQLAQEHRAKAVCQMLMTPPSIKQPAKLTEDAQPINLREILDEECDRLADEANRGEWDTLPNDVKYLKRKQYDTLLSYISLLDQLEKYEDNSLTEQDNRNTTDMNEQRTERCIHELRKSMMGYIGRKEILAKPMNRRDYNDLRGWVLPEDEDGDDEGYLVEYLDGGKANVDGFKGYISWSPKDVFERAYQRKESYEDCLTIRLRDIQREIHEIEFEIEHRVITDSMQVEFLNSQLKALKTYEKLLIALLEYRERLRP